jgi:hypothetical protein
VRRLAFLAVVALLLAAACGEDGDDRPAAQPSQAPPAATTAPDATGSAEETQRAARAGATLTLFVEAVGRGATPVVWELLSTQAKERLGPTEADFASRFAAELEEGVGSFANAAYDLVLAVETSPGWAVAAIAGERVAEGTLQALAVGPDERRAIVAGPTGPLQAGPHVVIGFAQAGAEAAAVAETFVAR